MKASSPASATSTSRARASNTVARGTLCSRGDGVATADRARRRPTPGAAKRRRDSRGLRIRRRRRIVKLSELFASEKDTLAIYSFMYGPERERPCPGCTHFLDALDGETEHILQRINLAVVAESPLPRIIDFAKERAGTAASAVYRRQQL